MKNTKSVMWGIVFIIIGVLIGLASFDIIDFNLFFDGWWTLFIIVPCLIDIIVGDDLTSNLIGLIIGVLLFLACNDIFSFEFIWKLIIPTILIIIGLSCIFKNFMMKKIHEQVKKVPEDNSYTAVFSGQKLNYDNEKFEGLDATAIFGGLDIDLRNAIFESDVTIDVTSVFGGVNLFIPKNVKVKVISSSIFGGVENKVRHPETDDNSKTIYINANCAFGGVDIKN